MNNVDIHGDINGDINGDIRSGCLMLANGALTQRSDVLPLRIHGLLRA